MADFIFDHFDDLISYNSSELAQLSEVSKATMSVCSSAWSMRSQETANLTQWVNALDAQQFADAMAYMVKARRIVIIGMRNAYPVAQSLSEELMDLTLDYLSGGGDGLRHRPRIIRPLMQELQPADKCLPV